MHYADASRTAQWDWERAAAARKPCRWKESTRVHSLAAPGMYVCMSNYSVLTAQQTDLDQARERAAQQSIKLSEISTAAEKEGELAKEAAAVSDGTLSQLKAFESYRDKMMANIRKRREQFGAANYPVQVSVSSFGCSFYYN